MTDSKKIEELEKKVKWNRSHLRIVFLMSLVTLLALVGHFFLHATGNIPH